MVDQVDCLWSLILLLVNFFKVLRKAITMALCSNSSHHLSWKRITETTSSSELASKGCKVKVHPVEDDESSPASPEKVQEGGVDESLEKKGVDSLPVTVGKKMPLTARKRPAKIVIPESFVSLGFGEVEKEKDLGEKEVEVEESEYCLASRKGKRHVMEDGYGVITNIHGDSNQAFFGVFDGHGGRAAVDFISEKLGKNIITALSASKKGEEDPLEVAIKEGYLTTDREFLSKGVSSGACVATVMFKDGEMHVANVGDCRVVMSKKGVANALTSDHRPGREDERIRIENSGGYVNCRNGVWRVQDSLAVSRAIGDKNMKEWVISEPETNKLKLTSECEFLIVASDGLWDKVSNQEAVDVVMKKKNSVRSCKELVDLSSRRGGRDDITVMVIDLQRFM